MPFKESFTDFFNPVKVSLTNGTFAKLTMAKTIGNSDLMNIYIRPTIEDHILKLEFKFKFQQEEIVEIHLINAACEKLCAYLNNPFLTAILFTTEFDLTYKLNKKRAVSVIKKGNTFGNPSEVLLEYLNQ